MKGDRGPAKEPYSCPVIQAMGVIGGKWKLVVICRLFEGVKRFGELKRGIPGITTKMLTQQLRELEGDSVVNRKVYAQVPPKVEYTLTPFGASLKPVIGALNDWGLKCQEIRREKKKRAAAAGG